MKYVRFSKRALAAVLAVAMLSQSASAIGSSKKSPEQDAAENARKATTEYNKGVDRMDKARTIILAGDSTFAYNYRATADAKARKEYEKAIKHFKKAIQYAPDMKEAFNNLGYCYRKIGALDESLASYNRAVELDPNFALAREYLGETYLAMGDLISAGEELEVLRKLESPYADTLAHSIKQFMDNEANNPVKR